MAEPRSLLSLIARGYAAGREDAATEALCFILSRSDSARDALAEFLGDNGDPLPIASFSTQRLVHGAYPDMACFDDDENHVAFVESKFWASLTSNQPVTYWKALPDDRPAVLLFLAPASRIARIDKGWLWHELVERLRKAGHTLGAVNQGKGLVTAESTDGKHRLLLTSWEVLLERLAQRTEKDGDRQAHFQVAELWGLAYDAIKDEDPEGPWANLKQLIADAVKQLEESGWANTEGLATGGSEGVHYARFLLLGGAAAGLRIDYRAVKQMGKPLWLWFWDKSRNPRKSVDFDEVREKLAALGELAEPGLEWLPKAICVPIDLPAGADREATLHAIVAELERIAKIIDPDGPTYRCDSTTG